MHMNDSAAMTFKTKLQDGRIPLPSRLRTLAGVSDGDPVNVTLIQGLFVVTPARRNRLSQAAKPQRRKVVLSRLQRRSPGVA